MPVFYFLTLHTPLNFKFSKKVTNIFLTSLKVLAVAMYLGFFSQLASAKLKLPHHSLPLNWPRFQVTKYSQTRQAQLGPENFQLLYCTCFSMAIYFKGQLISKAIYGLLTSPKKRTDEFVLFAFLLFTANKSNSSVRFLGESTARQCAFRN